MSVPSPPPILAALETDVKVPKRASPPWPGDDDATTRGPGRKGGVGARLSSLSGSLFYTYMDPVLRRGADLHRNRRGGGGGGDGGAKGEEEGFGGGQEELSMEDLYACP